MKQFLADIDSKRAFEHAAWLTQNAPFRQAGGEREHKAAQYVAEQMDKAGLQVTLHEFKGYVGFPGKGRLTVVGPDPVEIEVGPFAQATSTPPGGLEAELVFCGHASEDDFRDKDVRGKVVLSYLSFTPSRPEKTRLATINGAAGILMMHFMTGEYDNLPEGTVKALWGNPTDKDFHLMESVIPAGGLRRADGDRLLAMLEQGPVRVRLEVEAERRWAKMLLPMGVLPGAEDPDRFTLIGGHLCSWSGGATDNASGDGGILELARVAALHRNQLRRGIVAACWPGHEQGIMEGSTWFVDTMWDRLDRYCTLYINLDEMGKRGTSMIRASSSPESVGVVTTAVRDGLGLENIPVRDPHKSGDQSFLGIGIPSVWISSSPDEAQMKSWQGAEWGWWWHTRSDTLDKLDPEVQQRELLANAALLWRISNAEVLAFRFAPVAERIVRRLEELQAAAGDDLDLSAPREWAREFAGKARAVDAASEAGKDTNDIQMRLSRTLTQATATVAGRWAQDSYALTDLSTYIPGLRSAAELPRLRGSDRYYLVQTRLLRERNRVRDAIAEACRLVDASGAL